MRECHYSGCIQRHISCKWVHLQIFTMLLLGKRKSILEVLEYSQNKIDKNFHRPKMNFLAEEV